MVECVFDGRVHVVRSMPDQSCSSESLREIDERQRHNGVISLERLMFRIWLGSAVVQGRWLVLGQSDVVEMMELIENV